MAVKVMTPKKAELNKITICGFETTETASDGFKFTLPKTPDEYIVVVFANTDSANAHNVTIKKPVTPSYYGSASDETVSLAKGETAVFRFESAKWANRDGTIAIVTDNVAVKATVLY